MSLKTDMENENRHLNENIRKIKMDTEEVRFKSIFNSKF